MPSSDVAGFLEKDRVSGMALFASNAKLLGPLLKVEKIKSSRITVNQISEPFIRN